MTEITGHVWYQSDTDSTPDKIIGEVTLPGSKTESTSRVRITFNARRFESVYPTPEQLQRFGHWLRSCGVRVIATRTDTSHYSGRYDSCWGDTYGGYTIYRKAPDPQHMMQIREGFKLEPIPVYLDGDDDGAGARWLPEGPPPEGTVCLGAGTPCGYFTYGERAVDKQRAARRRARELGVSEADIAALGGK